MSLCTSRARSHILMYKRTPVNKDGIKNSIHLIPFTYVYGILLQVCKSRICFWYILTYADC